MKSHRFYALRHALVMACFFAFHAAVYSQTLLDSFDIATFARPDLRRTTAMVEPHFYFDNLNTANSTDKNTHIATAVGGIYMGTKFVNTIKTQSQQSHTASVGLGYGRNGYSANTNFRSISQFSGFNNTLGHVLRIAPYYRGQFSRKNFKENQRFFELGLTPEVNHRFTWIKRKDGVKSNLHDVSVNLGIPLYLGKGRIELVSDAWHAVEILEVLDKQQLLKRRISNEEIYGFASRIAEIKNFRNTDFRLERVAEFEALTKYLVDNEMVKTEDYRFFAHLLDAWEFEAFTQRFSGKEFKYGIVPDITLRNSSSKSSNLAVFEEGLFQIDFAARVEWNKYRPINKRWQKNTFRSIEAGYFINRNNSSITNSNGDLEDNSQINRISVHFNWENELQFLYSQRTNFFLNYRFTVTPILSMEREDGIDRDSYSISSVLAGNFTYRYYFSPQLSCDLYANANIFYFQVSDVGKYIRNNNFIAFRTSYRFF